MRAYHGPAEVVQHDTAHPVRCSFDIATDRVGLQGWAGDYYVAEIGPLLPPDGGDAILRLPDGREGAIVITRMTLNPFRGHFVGSGPAPGQFAGAR